MKKLKINGRTPQTFYQELIIPFVIVILFVAIGQADFFVAYPGLEMSPEKFGSTGVLYYNSDYSQLAASPKTTKKYVKPETMVDSAIMCDACGSDKLYTKKEKLVISADALKEEAGNQTKEVAEFEAAAFAKRDGENAFIYIHEISNSKITIVPNDPATFSPEAFAKKEYTPKPYPGGH